MNKFKATFGKSNSFLEGFYGKFADFYVKKFYINWLP